MNKTLSLADKIRYARTEAGLSQKELGTKIRLSDKAVSSYEVGRAQPSVEILRDISAATRRPITYFIDEEHSEEIDLAVRLQSIELELAEIKQALKDKGYEL
jgi:transcriptional regulator with XRE-family HTH domain